MESRAVCITRSSYKGTEKLLTLEKRQAPRADLKLECSVNFSARIKARSVNISETGICLFTDDDLGDNKFISLVINLGADEVIKAIGKVVWCQQLQPLLYQYGLQFWYLETKKADLFKEFIQQNIK